MRLPDGTVDAARPVAGLMHTGGFTVLCFLGPGGGATLEAVGALRGLLGGLGATAYGVSLLGEETGSMPISMLPCHGACRGRELTGVVHDVNRILTSRMGLLHPLGGGRTALDAVVVLDAESRARIVLPLGWGVRGALDDGGNRWENVVGRVVRGVEWLRMEMAERVVREMEGMEVEMLTV